MRSDYRPLGEEECPSAVGDNMDEKGYPAPQDVGEFLIFHGDEGYPSAQCDEAYQRPDADEDNTAKHRRSIRRDRIMIAAAAAVVVLFGIILGTMYGGLTGSNGTAPNNGRRENSADPPPRDRSVVQDLLSNQEWVTPAFLPINEYSRPGLLIDEVNSIVIHYIGNPGTTAQQNRNYFANLGITGETHASSNFIVCLDGQILQCVPVDEIAYASNNRNVDSISIELCHPDETGKFTEETYASAIRLTVWLCQQYGLTQDDVIRHFDVTGKECPKYFTDNEDAWEAFRADVAEALRR